QYLPGNTSETLWTEYLPHSQLPQIFNPDSGFFQNSNNDPFQTTLNPENPDRDAYSPTLGITDPMSNRSLRSLELFGNDESITYDEFVEYKYDMGFHPDSDLIRAIHMILDAPAPADSAQNQAYNLLAEWDYQSNPENKSTAIAILTLYYLLENDNVDISVSNMVGGAFTQADAIDSFEKAVALMMENYGRIDVEWQEVNRLIRGDVDLGIGGAPDVLHAVYGDLGEDGRFRGIAGDSYVMIIAWDADGNLTSESIHQYGSATLVEDSPHYADQAPIFVQRELKPVWMDEAIIRENLNSAYAPGEE
ncbi:MAG: penicillin acylase family protein, partial [Chloroflexota bacterium]